MKAEGPEAKVLLADRGYDSDHIRETLEEKGATPVIPTRQNRKVHIPVDGHIYALRNRIERCFNKLKNSRRLATRYDKTMASYLGFVHIAAIRIWMRAFVNKTYELGEGHQYSSASMTVGKRVVCSGFGWVSEPYSMALSKGRAETPTCFV